MRIKVPNFPVEDSVLNILSPKSIENIIESYSLELESDVIIPFQKMSNLYMAGALYLRLKGISNDGKIRNVDTISKKFYSYKLSKLVDSIEEFKSHSFIDIESMGIDELNSLIETSSKIDNILNRNNFKSRLRITLQNLFFSVSKVLIYGGIFWYTYILAQRANEVSNLNNVDLLSIHLVLFFIGILFINPIQVNIQNKLHFRFLKRQLLIVKTYPTLIVDQMYNLLESVEIKIQSK